MESKKEYHQFLSFINFPKNENCSCQMGEWSMICTWAIFSGYACEWMSADL